MAGRKGSWVGKIINKAMMLWCQECHLHGISYNLLLKVLHVIHQHNDSCSSQGLHHTITVQDGGLNFQQALGAGQNMVDKIVWIRLTIILYAFVKTNTGNPK